MNGYLNALLREDQSDWSMVNVGVGRENGMIFRLKIWADIGCVGSCGLWFLFT